ncbi:MADCA protein, partial [Heliornis fulica]|nr:MADCA protein [Heliornis fulica]
MELAPLLLLLFLRLLWGCSGRPADRLSVMPQEPVVQYGGSVQLNCSLTCTGGGTVQWKGLDTNLGSVTSFPTHSILHISSAVVAVEGTKICQGTCHGQLYQHVVQLKVYAVPDMLQLEASPNTLEPGQPTSLHCSAQGLYPISGLVLTWYRGGQALEADFNVVETDEELFDIMSTLPVSGKEVVKGVEFRCEVTVSIGHKTFTRVASVVASAGATTELVTTAASTGTTLTATAGTPSTAGPVTTTALTPEPSVPTTSHTARPATTSTGTVTAPPQGTSADSIQLGSPQAKNGMGPTAGPASDCSLQIWSLPPSGMRGRALRIECHARCAGNTSVRWLRTPVALSQYQEEAVGSSSVLQLDRAEPRHQGHYQCVLLGHLSQVVSLQLVVLDDPFSTIPAIAGGTTVSLLGLVVAAITSHCLWKRFRSQYKLS